jgi:D-3-phosphoglycerate dehydrogenase
VRTVLRWGRSAYETDADLALEAAAAERAGLAFHTAPESADAPPLDGVDVLLVTSRVRVTAAVLARFPGSLVLTTTSGWDHVDVAAAKARKVTVARCPTARRDAVVEQALGHLLALSRRQPAFDRHARRGEWARGQLPALDPLGLRGQEVLVVGHGVIGRRMSEVLLALGAVVTGVDPAGTSPGVLPVDLDEGVARAAAVTLHCALVPSTRGLFDARRLARLRPDAVLVNTARGELVDVDAAVAAVREGHLRGFATDVFPTEPYPGLQAAAAVEGVLVTPHSAGFTRALGRRVAADVDAALAAWAGGRPVPHQVHGDG